MTIYLVRHGRAGDRTDWDGPDRLRPLTKAGRRQAEALARLLADTPVQRVLSSSYLRCIQTVEPLAAARGLPVETVEPLEEGRGSEPALGLMAKLTRLDAVLCSHRDVIQEILEHLSDRGIELSGGLQLRKSSVWVFRMDEGQPVHGRYLPPP